MLCRSVTVTVQNSHAEADMRVELFNITKRFGSFIANDKINLHVEAGEVLALLGENGAGKSTLMKVLFGLYQPDEGAVLIDGRETQVCSPTHAMQLGLGMVFQQFNLIPALSVLDNLLLAYPKPPFWTFRTLLGQQQARVERVTQHLHALAPDIKPHRPVSSLSVGQRQIIELVKVLNLEARCIILDEPTSVLTPQEAQALWKLIKEMADSGRSIILITHKMEDVMACADRISVLREGKLQQTLLRSECTEDSLVRLMMGSGSQRDALSLPDWKSVSAKPNKVDLRNLSVTLDTQRLRDISLQIKPGEVLGLAGVSGNGQHLLADALMGLTAWEAGELILDGVLVQSPSRQNLCPQGVAYIPEQPAVNAVAPDLDLTFNVAMGQLRQLPFVPDWQPQRERTRRIINDFNVRPDNPSLPAGQLSGGNLQKLVVGRELDCDPLFIIAAYPAMGLDAAATQEVYRALFDKARQGAAILWISEDLDDLMAYAHRIAVIHHGAITYVAETQDTDRYTIGRAMTGGTCSLEELEALPVEETNNHPLNARQASSALTSHSAS